jgi:hypothetical protein
MGWLWVIISGENKIKEEIERGNKFKSGEREREREREAIVMKKEGIEEKLVKESINWVLIKLVRSFLPFIFLVLMGLVWVDEKPLIFQF